MATSELAYLYVNANEQLRALQKAFEDLQKELTTIKEELDGREVDKVPGSPDS